MPIDRPYKIVYCTPALYSAGGVERIVSVKASYFAEQYGYDVTIIVTEGIGKPPFFPISDKIHIVNLNIDFEELWNKPFWYKIVLYVLKQHKYKKSLKEELLRLRPDITISTLRREINFLAKINDDSLKIGELHLNRANFRALETSKSSLTQRLFVKWWKKKLVSHLRALDKLVVLTESSVKEWPELDNVVMIPDPLPIQVDSKSPLTSKHVVTIGRYSFEKGYDLLLRSWAIVQKEVPDWHLDIYGMGDAAAYKEQAAQLDIDLSRCHFYGSVSDVQKVYNNSSVFALTSRFEGFGLVLVEAMASGVPIISYACQSGPIELISDGQNGLLVPLGDVSAFAEKLICLIKDPELRASLSEDGLKTVQSCSLEKVASQWKAMFDNLMRGK
jgi:glycosyltransferase involved in cell wall biosynthesis